MTAKLFLPMPYLGGDEAAVNGSVYLHPGQVLVSTEPRRITTILGSCVAVCLWDRAFCTGGMNHFLLPDAHGESLAHSTRFAAPAMRQLVEGMRGCGSRTANLEAKLFGGACVLNAFTGRERHIGTQNVETARRLLQYEGIPLVAEDVGGVRGRKLVFDTADGAVFVKLV